MQNDGENLKRMVTDSNVSTASFARLMKANKNTPYNWFKAATLRKEILQQAAIKLNVKLFDYFPHLAKEATQLISGEADTLSSKFYVCRLAEKDAEYLLLLKKYTTLLEDHNQLLRQNNK